MPTMLVGDPVKAAGDASDRYVSEDARRRALIAGLLLFVLLVLLAAWLLSRTAVVPDVRGMTDAEARSCLVEAGFEVGEVAETAAVRDERPETVIEQSPAPGTRSLVRARVALVEAVAQQESGRASGDVVLDDGYLDLPEEGREVDLVGLAPESPPVNEGPRVPSVLGKDAEEARRVLAAAGYAVSVDHGPSTTDVPEGIAYVQDPPPGAYEPRGTNVLVTISTGAP